MVELDCLEDDNYKNVEYVVYKFGKVDISFGELLLYSMRHVQHGAAQLNLILRQTFDMSSPWVFKAKNNLSGE